jgi:hypothetical protein
MDVILAQAGVILAERVKGEGRSDIEIGGKWLCQQGKTGHVLGISARVRVEVEIRGRKRVYYVDRLMKFRNAIDPQAEQPAEVEVDCEIEGTVYDIRCTVCGMRRTWWMGEAGLERFLEGRKRGQRGE